jgi:SET domain-containing protein
MNTISYISPKTHRIEASKISGKGLISKELIHKGEIVAIKSGHIIDLKTFEEKYEPIVGMSILQIDDNFVIGPITEDEIKDMVIFLNHSCNPNVGLRGEVTFVAMRDIDPGEEIVIDYALIQNNDDDPMVCNCQSPQCRKTITGKDWQNKFLQEKYREYFSAFLQKKF